MSLCVDDRLVCRSERRWFIYKDYTKMHSQQYVKLSEMWSKMYRVIHKSLRDFRPLRYSSRDGHAEVEHVNRGRGTPSFCPTLQVLDMSTLGDVEDVNPVIKLLPHTYLGVSVSLLTCSPSAWPSRLLYRSGRKSRRDLWITLYIGRHVKYPLFLSGFIETWSFRTFLFFISKNIQVSFFSRISALWEPSCPIRADLKKTNIDISQFCEHANKNRKIIRSVLCTLAKTYPGMANKFLF